MSNERAGHGGDRIIEILERGQNWVVENRNKIVMFFIAFLAVAFWYESHLSSKENREKDFWEKSSQLKSVNEIENFVKTHAGTDAGKYMSLQLIRKQLEAGSFDKAKNEANTFIATNPESKYIGLATLLRGYANEELGKVSEAKTDYQKVSEKPGVYTLTAEKALERLKE
jgi:predicted negative regulator of RcsB-dependent stress response